MHCASSEDLSFALKVPSLIRPKGTMEDDLQHALAVDRARRVEPQRIRVWLQSLVWLREVNCTLPSCVVCDLREPPSWIYAAYRFFVGPVAFRPRDFRRVDRAAPHVTCCLALGAAPPEEVARLDPAGVEEPPPLIQATPELEQLTPVEDDSSDEEDLAAPEDPPQPKMLQVEAPPIPPLLPPVMILPLKKDVKVPSLSFTGIRPSMQGCSGLGAPPPEEPGIQPEVQSPFVPPASPEELEEGPDSSDEELYAELAEAAPAVSAAFASLPVVETPQAEQLEAPGDLGIFF
eukprot:s983_g18.t1